MADRMTQAILAARAWISQNPGQFGGVEPANTIPHLGIVNRPLWEQLKAAYEAEVGNTGRSITGKGGPTLNEWALQNPALGNELRTALPDQPPPAPPPAPPQVQAQPNLDQTIQSEADKRQQEFLQQQLDQIYGQVQTQGENAIDQEFIPARQKAIAEEAALGRLTSPVSIVPLARLDQSKQLALGNLYGNIAGQKAAGQVDVAKTIDTILNARKDASQQNAQFLQDLNLRSSALGEQSRQFNEKLNLDRMLGLAGIDASKYNATASKNKDFLDYLLGGTQSYANYSQGRKDSAAAKSY